MNETNDQVFRDALNEHRGEYFVTYHPADSRLELATLDLVFPEKQPSPESIRQLMEKELDYWLARFPVPVMVASFDASESLVDLPEERGGSYLMGYVEPGNGRLVRRWGLIKTDEMPSAQLTADHFARTYQDVPCRL